MYKIRQKKKVSEANVCMDLDLKMRKGKTCTSAHMTKNDNRITGNKPRPDPKLFYTTLRLGKNCKTVFKHSFGPVFI